MALLLFKENELNVIIKITIFPKHPYFLKMYVYINAWTHLKLYHFHKLRMLHSLTTGSNRGIKEDLNKNVESINKIKISEKFFYL